MIVTAWNNGKHLSSGAGYGLRLSTADRDRYFRPEWRNVAVLLPDWTVPVTVELSPSFWRRCSELRHRDIGRWLYANGYVPWPKGKPPSFVLEPVGNRQFQISVKTGGYQE